MRAISTQNLNEFFSVTEHDMHFWDALLAATMRRNGIFNIYTENAKDFKASWISAVNPFAKNRLRRKQKPAINSDIVMSKLNTVLIS